MCRRFGQTAHSTAAAEGRRNAVNDLVTDLDTLQGHVGRLPAPRDLKVIDYLDDNALRWLAASPFMFAAFGDPSGIR